MTEEPPKDGTLPLSELTERAMAEARRYARGDPSETVVRVGPGAFTVELPASSSGQTLAEVLKDQYGFVEDESRFKTYPDGRTEYKFCHPHDE